MGKRLGEYTKYNTKCMVPVNGIPLIDRVLRQLSGLNLNRVVIVVGYEGKKLMDYLGDSYNGLKIEYVNNPIYDKTNNIYSLFLAKDKMMEELRIDMRERTPEEQEIMKKLLKLGTRFFLFLG